MLYEVRTYVIVSTEIGIVNKFFGFTYYLKRFMNSICLLSISEIVLLFV